MEVISAIIPRATVIYIMVWGFLAGFEAEAGLDCATGVGCPICCVENTGFVG